MAGAAAKLVETTLRADGVLSVSLCRPKVNAMNAHMFREIASVMRTASARDDVRGVVLSSPFKVFSAGLDLGEVAALVRSGDREAVRSFIFDDFYSMLRATVDVPKPLAVAVDGHAVAGGLLLALCADFIAVNSTASHRLSLPEAAVGVPLPQLPADLATRQLPPALVRSLIFDCAVLRTDSPAAASALHACAAPLDAADDYVRRAIVHPAAGFAALKRNYWRDVRARPVTAEDESALVDAMLAPEALVAIERALNPKGSV